MKVGHKEVRKDLLKDALPQVGLIRQHLKYGLIKS